MSVCEREREKGTDSVIKIGTCYEPKILRRQGQRETFADNENGIEKQKQRRERER